MLTVQEQFLAPLSARSSNISRHIGMVLANRLFTPFRCQHTENPQKPLLSYLNIIITPSLLLSVFCFRKSLFRSFVILTIIILLLKLLSFIVTYRQLYKECSNSVTPLFQAFLAHKFFMRFASRQMIFECAILVIAVKILGRQKGKFTPDLYSSTEGKRQKAMPSPMRRDR